ncbi:MAG: HlyD family efflux transporter periplasmic adaptor subunit [Cyanobacteria bacterium SBLK]|nr:HlyD family efflux transporter periplasmic adaptor subunit [Cyanobacteria bacterium SBLK]
MTSSSRPSLKAVPPTNIPSKQPEKNPSPSREPASPPPEIPHSANKLRTGAIALILIAGGVYILSPATIYVKGIAHFEPRENQVRGIFLDFPGKVKQFWVNYGEEVEKEQLLADVEAIALESEITQKKAQLQEKQAQLETQKTQITVLEAELMREGQKIAIAKRREQDFRTKLNRGINAPEMQKIIQEINSIETRLMNIKSERAKLVSQFQGINNILKEYDTTAMQQLQKDGAISRISLTKELTELESKKVALQAQIQQQDRHTLDIQHQIRAKSAELELLQENRQERLQERQDELISQVADIVPLRQKLAAAKITVENLIPVIETLESEVKKLETLHSQNTIIKSPLTGTVITPDLPQKIGQKITEDKPVLTIANLDEMVATIAITQGDAGLVKKVFGKRELPVKLKPREIEIAAFESSIKDIEPVFDRDESGQKQLMRVRATFNNRDRFLSPNSEADASIAVERLPRYRIWWREIWKQLRQYF